MCGIAGIFHLDGKPVDRQALAMMQAYLAHRGPDGEGLFSKGYIGLAHRRLKIIDLSDAAGQPFSDHEHGVTLVYNGEIYNYLELKAVLETKGFRFRTASDTEVLLCAYLQWGHGCLSRLNGMFAFALWDQSRKQLFCARDRMGVKPFYFHFDGKTLAFASEIKALLTLPWIGRQPNMLCIYDYLVYSLVDHTAETFFNGIHRLPAATHLLADTTGIKLNRYWDFTVNTQIHKHVEIKRHARQFRSLIEDAVRLRLRSDVPVGSCLSGGIDSSAIVCMINLCMPTEVKQQIERYQKTYSAVFDRPELDERDYIKQVIETTGADAHWIYPGVKGLLSEIDRLIWHQEEPFSSTSIYAQWCVFRCVRDSRVKVVLDGQGADEQLCGYRKFYYFYLRELGRRRALGQLLREGSRAIRNYRFFTGIDVKHSMRYLKKGPDRSFLRSLFKEPLYRHQPEKNPIGYDGSLADRIKLDMVQYSLPALLRYEDKNAMAFGVESRTPYLDFRVVEFLASLPLNSKIHNGWTKAVLRSAVADIVPPEICRRRDKLAFDTPQDLWLKHAFSPHFEKVCSKDGLLSACIEPKNLLREYHRYVSGTSRLSGNFFFKALLLQRWADCFSL